MALYAEGLGHYQNECDDLWQRLVPKSGSADTLQGELVRLIGKLADEYYRNENINWSDSFRNMTTCLETELSQHFSNLSDQQAIHIYLHQIVKNGETGRCYYLDGEDQYDKITDYVVRFCQESNVAILNSCPSTYQYSL